MFKTMHKLQIMIGAVAVSMVCSSCFALTMKSAPDMGLFKKKKKTVEQPVSDYKKLVGSDSVNVKGVMNVVKKDQDFYLEMPVKLMGRVFLVSNKLLLAYPLMFIVEKMFGFTSVITLIELSDMP